MERSCYEDELIEMAATIFSSETEGVWTVPVDYPRPYPRTYVFTDLGSAAIEAIQFMGIDDTLPENHFGLRDEVIEGVKKIVNDWEEITLKRERMARILNQYSGHNQSFNPN